MQQEAHPPPTLPPPGVAKGDDAVFEMCRAHAYDPGLHSPDANRRPRKEPGVPKSRDLDFDERAAVLYQMGRQYIGVDPPRQAMRVPMNTAAPTPKAMSSIQSIGDGHIKAQRIVYRLPTA